MAKHIDETISILTKVAENRARDFGIDNLEECLSVSRIGQTVCTTPHITKGIPHGGFSNVTDEFRTWGKHRA